MDERPFLACTILIFGSAVAGAFVDNIPHTAAMVPIVAELVTASGGGSDSPLWWAFVLVADLGGNTPTVAAGANVVAIGPGTRSASGDSPSTASSSPSSHWWWRGCTCG